MSSYMRHTVRSAGTAVTDCSTCRRRRITCDRTLPSCVKCGSRSLDCPGYVAKLRWVQGPTARVPSKPKDLVLVEEVQTRTRFFTDNASRGPQALLNMLVETDDVADEQLLHHYKHVVAPQMVWLHSAQNPFITVMLPLAFQSPALMMAILSVSAGDLWTRRHEYTSGQLRATQRWGSYQQRALSHLAKYLRDQNQQCIDEGTEAKDHASPGLAAFMLSSLSIKLGCPKAWTLHSHAAWIMAEHANYSDNTVSLLPNDETLLLLAEVYALKVWKSVTTFEPVESRLDIPSLTRHTPFMQYLETIRLLSEHKIGTGRDDPMPQQALSILMAESMLQEASESTRQCSRNLTVRSLPEHVAFELVVEIFHQAGLLYAAQVLEDDPLAEETATEARRLLFHRLQQLVVTEVIAQDLPWPLFLAGAVCFGDRQKEQFVEARMLEIMRLSGALERPRLLQFLQELWCLQINDRSFSWITLARRWAHEGRPLLII